MKNLFQDLRFGLRSFQKSPAFSAIAVLALALGIGLTTTMFSIVHGALRDLPFGLADRLYHLERNNLSLGVDSIEVTDARLPRLAGGRRRAFEGLAGFYSGTINLSGRRGKPERYEGAYMTANAFDVLGAQAAARPHLPPRRGRGPGAPRTW